MWIRRLLTVTWPAFLTASLLEMLVFAMVDPHDLHWFDQPLDEIMPRLGIYTVAFFAFWLVACASSALTLLLGLGSDELNRDP
jgi:hypothetical protein